MRADLPAGFKARLTKVLRNLDLSSLTPAERKHLMGAGPHMVPTTDAAYDIIRDLVGTLRIDLAKL